MTMAATAQSVTPPQGAGTLQRPLSGTALHGPEGIAGAVKEEAKLNAPASLVAVNGFEMSEDAEELSGFPRRYGSLPVSLQVTVPVREFRVRNLLAMAPGEIIETLWAHGEDLPLASGGVQLAWTEFVVVDTRLAVRVTRLI